MSKTYSGIAVLAVILIPAVAWWTIADHNHRLAWALTSTLMLLFIVATGQTIVGRWAGILIDDRNVISLSRFQMTVWTVIVMSAYITAAFYNIYTGVDDPLAIGIPKQLWLAMGISTTSLVGTPLLLAPKTTKEADPTKLQATLEQLQSAGEQPGDTKVMGQVIGNTKPGLAGWSDMLTGDETSNGAHVDLAKIQMLFFTLAITVSYCFALWRTFKYAQPDGITEFPALDESALALLGISHSGYLINKAVPRS